MSKNKSSQTDTSMHFHKNFEPQTGICVKIAPQISRICAPNSGPYTFTGTNTYLVGSEELFVIDPGPKDKKHLKAIVRAINNRPVKAILLTHTHKDHSTLAYLLQREIDAPIWFEGKHRLSRPKRAMEVNLLHSACDWHVTPERTLADGETIHTNDISLKIMATPGHCANHLCFGVNDTPYLFSGDHVMGWNSTLIATPDGSMADYFQSLKTLSRATWTVYFPGHGAPIDGINSPQDGPTYARALSTHRMLRNRQILSAVGKGASSINQIVKAIYPTANASIRIAAALTVQAHIEYLEKRGELSTRHSLRGQKITPVLK